MTQSNQPPVIGITAFSRNETGSFCLFGTYVDAIRNAGGIPILLPPGETDCDRILQLIDGVVLTGGGDIDPTVYGGSSHPTIYKINSERDTFELTLAQLVLKTNKPVLGICRGLQVLSVASGGRLIPHVPDQFGEAIAHRLDQFHSIEHKVQIVPQSRLAKILEATEVEIVSWHHQAVQSKPPGWQISAYAPDGLIEALEHETHPWAIALQWHPEMSLNDPAQQRIFAAFVAAACDRYQFMRQQPQQFAQW